MKCCSLFEKPGDDSGYADAVLALTTGRDDVFSAAGGRGSELKRRGRARERERERVRARVSLRENRHADRGVFHRVLDNEGVRSRYYVHVVLDSGRE